MKMEYDFVVKRPINDVWHSFKDIPTVASCMPGAELTEDLGEGNYKGNVKVKLGPFSVSFDGQAKVNFEDNTKSGDVVGNGIDKKGGNRTKLSMKFFLEKVPEGTKTNIDADIQLSGAIAQFGRIGIIKETANIIIRKFSENLENKLSESHSEENDSNIKSTTDNKESHISLGIILNGLIKWFLNLFLSKK